MSNRLKNQSSPYLLQHSENPVDWYPWCEEAFEKAGREDKPVFLSIGYSTCHWCHVMAHESFEDPGIASILNRFYVSIKVDREERPDIDSVYMAACQAFTGSGGWPMSLFLTAGQEPFFGGTYFPPESSRGMTGFRDLLLIIAAKWKNDREVLLESAGSVLAHLERERGGYDEEIDRKLPGLAAESLSRSFSRQYGGFGPAPKFPMPHNLLFLTLYAKLCQNPAALEQVRITLTKMRRGGIFDQIGYGFSRYSTDPYFLVPHFEKMLYDNALLIMAYSAAYKATGDVSYLTTAEETAEYVFREMTGPEGEFYSAQDADSEGREGKYYTWKYEEVCEVLGKERGRRFCDHFDITRQGNFEGENIPNLLKGSETCHGFGEEKEILYQYRRERGRLSTDDKILTAWNSLMIAAMAMLYRVTGKRQYLSAAVKARQFLAGNLAEGQILYVGCRDGVRPVKGFLDEYAYYTAALLFLYEVTADRSYLEDAERYCCEAERQFADPDKGGYFLYGPENAALITRPKETYDGAVPGGNSVMAYCLVRLFQITGKEEYRRSAERQLRFMSGEARDFPAGYGLFLTVLLAYENPRESITVVLSEEDSAEGVFTRLPLYADVEILPEETGEYKRLNGKTTYYVCRDHTCLPPADQYDQGKSPGSC